MTPASSNFYYLSTYSSWLRPIAINSLVFFLVFHPTGGNQCGSLPESLTYGCSTQRRWFKHSSQNGELVQYKTFEVANSDKFA